MGIELCHSDKFQIQEVGIFLLGYSAHHNISALSFLKDTVRQHETMCGKICGKVCSVSFPPVPLNLYLSTSIRHPVKTGYESERQDHTQGIARAPEYPALRRARNLQTSHDSSKKIVIEKPSMRTAFIRMEGDPALFRRGLLLFRCRRLGLPSPAPMTAAVVPPALFLLGLFALGLRTLWFFCPGRLVPLRLVCIAGRLLFFPLLRNPLGQLLILLFFLIPGTPPPLRTPRPSPPLPRLFLPEFLSVSAML